MAGEPPPHVLRVPRWTLAIHAVQILFAIIILGLDAYGIRWIAYNALIYSLVCCICTLGVCVYLCVSQLVLYNFYNMYIALIAHIWMIIFWLVDLGLVANLARLWSGPSCSYSYWYGYYCTYGKRDLSSIYRRDTTTTGAYYGALAAGAVFAAIQFVTWIVSAVFLLIHINKHRSAASNQTHPTQPPPQYAPNNGQAVPMEKYNQSTVQPVQQTPQPQYAQPAQPQGHFVQPPQQQQFTAPYPHDPVSRQDTVSPVSQVGYAAPNPNVSELSTSQHTGGYPPHPNASEMMTPQHTGEYPPNASELSTQK